MSTPSGYGVPPAVYLPPPPPPPGYGYATLYASLGARFVAALLDLLVLAVIALVVALPFGLLAAASLIAFGNIGWVWAVLFGPFTVLMVLLFFGYFTYFEHTTGQTPGKRALGIRVVELSTGRPPDLGTAVLRNVLRIVDWLPALYLVGFLVAALTDRRQRIGDLVANTVVVRA